MSVMQRKLFANKEARTKLRDMGGIMSSFPELSGEVQRFQAGGGVTPGFRPTAAPGPIRVEQVAADLGLTVPEFAQAAEDMGMTVAQFEQYVTETGGEAAPPNRWADYDLPAYISFSPPARSTPTIIDRLAVTPFFGGTQLRATPEGGTEEVPYEERLSQRVAQRVAAPESTEEPAPAEEEPGMTTGTPIYEQRIADLLPTSTETPDETGGGETDTPDIRARAEERIKLFQDLFGSDEPTARDRAMQFAMIGLAIAAGQSPNALTNIASGLLAGTQAMTAQEAERRKERRALQSSAVTSVLNEIEAERKAAAEAAKRSGEDYQPTESYADAVLKMTDTLIKEGEDPVAADRLARQLVDPLYGRGTPVDTGTVERGRQLVQQLRDSGRTDTEIARLVREAGLDPADLGVTDGQ